MRSLARLALVILAVGSSVPVRAQKLLHDVDPRPANTLGGSTVQNICTAGKLVFFTAGEEKTHGIHRTDGTASGTFLLREAYASELTALGSRALWLENVYPYRSALWRSDGTRKGTGLLLGDLPQRCGRVPPAVVGKLAYFGLVGVVLVTDGTPAGTRRITLPAWLGCDVLPIASGQSIFFSTWNRVTGDHFLFTIPPGQQSPVPVPDTTPGNLRWFPGSFEQLGADHYCLVTRHTSGPGLFKISGWPLAMRRVHAGTLFRSVFVRKTNTNEPADSMVRIGSRLYFAAETAAAGVELWSSDGTAAGTKMVADSTPGAGSSWPHFLASSNGRILFAKASHASGTPSRLWVSDGTTAGTKLLSAQPANPTFLTPVGATTYFSAVDKNGRELWKTDGTTAGTKLVKDIRAGGASSFPMTTDRKSPDTPMQPRANHAVLGQRLLFSAVDDRVGEELWITDGTSAGTQPVADVQSTWSHGYVGRHVRSGDHAWFTGPRKNGFPSDLWWTDGVRATRVFTGFASSPAPLDDGRVLFASGSQILLAAPGKMPVAFRRGIDVSRVASGRVYLVDWLSRPSRRAEIYATDGTAAGTRPLMATANPPSITSDGVRDYIVTRLTLGGSFAFHTDGTTAGTRSVPVPIFEEMTVGDGVAFFRVAGGTVPYYKFDGRTATPAPGLAVIDPKPTEFTGMPFGKFTLFLTAKGLWKTDGSTAGTVRLAQFRDRVSFGLMRRANDRVFFFADDGRHGRELWVTGGTPGTTRMVIDLHPTAGQPFADIVQLGAGDRVLFVGDDGLHGQELWMSDGTRAGTRRLTDLRKGAGSGCAPFGFLEFHGRMLFGAMSGKEGFEPHVLDLAKLHTPIAQTIGRGCPGTGNVTPQIDVVSAPTIGNNRFGIALRHALGRAPFVLGVAPNRRPVNAGSCALEIVPALGVAGTTSAVGTASLTMPLPNAPVLLGQRAVAQFAVSDRSGGWFGQVSLSPGLRLVVGL